MGGNKHLMLLIGSQKELIHSKDIVDIFGYDAGTARSYISRIARQGLLERTPRGHLLTDRGKDRLQFFEVQGCPDPNCPRCKGKKGYYECPRCGYELNSGEIEVSPAWETPFFQREAGVYCPRCLKQIFTKHQVRLIKGLKERERKRLSAEDRQARQIDGPKEEKSVLDEFFDYFMEGKT